MAGGRSVNADKCEELCEHASAMEQLAAKAERASIKYKQVEFMAERVGQEFDGKVSGVTEFGLYVEIDENKCEGMVPLRDLEGDYYEFDDPVRIRVARANIDRKQLDFALVATDEPTPAVPKTKGRGRRKPQAKRSPKK